MTEKEYFFIVELFHYWYAIEGYSSGKLGGFPEAILFENKRNWISNLYEMVLLNDVIVNNNIEVDFYIPEEKTAIQVCVSLQDEETKERECDSRTSRHWA